MTALAHDDRGAGVLAHRQDAASGDVGVFEQVQGHKAVIGRGFGVIEDVAQLLKVTGAQQVCDVAHGLKGQ